MSFFAYKLIHLAGIFTFVTMLAAVLANAGRGDRSEASSTAGWVRIALFASLAVVITAGFGMLARMGVLAGGGGLPGWVALKLGLWFGLGALVVVPRLGVRTARVLLFALPIAVVAAGAVAIFKPLSG